MSEKNPIASFLTVLLSIYGLSVSIFFVYFNYLYVKENGFVNWLLFGEVIATLKSIVWPIFIFLID